MSKIQEKAATIYLLRKFEKVFGYRGRNGYDSGVSPSIPSEDPNYRLAFLDSVIKRKFPKKEYSSGQIEKYWSRGKMSSHIFGCNNQKKYNVSDLIDNVKYIGNLLKSQKKDKNFNFRVRFFESTVPGANEEVKGPSARISIGNGDNDYIDLIYTRDGYICYQPGLMQNLTGSMPALPYVEKARQSLENFSPAGLEEVKEGLKSLNIERERLKEAYNVLQKGESSLKTRLKTGVSFKVISYLKELIKNGHPLSEIYRRKRTDSDILHDYTLSEIVKSQKSPAFKDIENDPSKRSGVGRIKNKLKEMASETGAAIYKLRQSQYDALITSIRASFGNKRSFSEMENNITSRFSNPQLAEQANSLLQSYGSKKTTKNEGFIEDILLALRDYAGIVFGSDDSELKKIMAKGRNKKLAVYNHQLIETKEHLTLLEKGAGSKSDIEKEYKLVADSLGMDYEKSGKLGVKRKLNKLLRESQAALSEAFENTKNNSYGIRIEDIFPQMKLLDIYKALASEQREEFESLYGRKIQREIEAFAEQVISQAHINTSMYSYCKLEELPKESVFGLSELLGISEEDVRRIEGGWMKSRADTKRNSIKLNRGLKR